jgi:hypothetical protein
MESPKNIISGSVNTNGGDVVNGNNNTVVKIIDGLSFLLSEYREQLNQINGLILAFKPKTALDLLISLEKRINDSNTEKDNKIASKILFLKALCKRELESYTKEDSAQDFIKAYNLNKEDETIKLRACGEYLNLDDSVEAIKLADDILNTEPYNGIAWIVKTFTSNDIKQFIQTVPKIVLNDYKYQHSIIYNIISTKKLRFFNDFEDYGLQLTFDFQKYKVVTFENKQAWIIALDLLMSTIINKSTIKYISGENFIVQNDPEVIKVINMLEFFTNTLESTEISNSTKHQKFYLNYLKYLSSNDEVSFKSLEQLYNKLEKPHWIYTLFYCQILNHKKAYQESLDCLVEYEMLKGEFHSEFYLFKSVALHFLSRHEEIEILYNDYLNSIVLIDERHLFNIINAFYNIQQHVDDKSKFEIQLEKVLEKKFIVDDLKVLLKVSIELKYIGKYDVEEIFSSLNVIKDNNLFDYNCKNLIAENFDQINKTLDALNFIDSYIDKTFVSESLRLYIILLHRLLQNKEDTPKGKANELIALLKFWRVKSNYIDEQLLRIEHELYAKINDLDNLEQIDLLLYSNFPDNMQYLYFYLAVLERRSNFAKIKELSISIPNIYEDESLGIGISGILLRNKNNTKKGFEILYKLALDQNNTEARENYFGGSLLFNEHFANYDSVALDHWVSHSVDGKIVKRKIVKSEGIQKEFLGKKIGEKFTNINPLIKKESVIEVIEIFNDALNLFRDIEDEAHNPINELGFVSFQIPPNIENLPQFLVEQFGAIGTVEKNRTDELLDDYYNSRIGYLVVVNAVFKGKFIDAYLHLTGSKDSKFTTIPNTFTAVINKQNHTIKFVLDFSSLMLFYYLERELNFKFKHKFIVSHNTKAQIETELAEVINSPESTLSVNITSDGIENHIYPEGIKNRRIDFLQSILDWIDNNCEIDLVVEKLDVILKLSKKEGKFENAIMNNMIDSLHLSIRENHRFISSDVSTFLFETNKIINNFLNPEKYLLTYYPEKCNSDFYRFLLKSNYVGIDIRFKTLKDEFIAFITSKENYYLSALENLQFSVNNNPNIILTCLNFLNYLYSTALPLSVKNKYAFEIFKNSLHGMGPDLINQYHFILIKEAKFPDLDHNEILNVFCFCKSINE